MYDISQLKSMRLGLCQRWQSVDFQLQSARSDDSTQSQRDHVVSDSLELAFSFVADAPKPLWRRRASFSFAPSEVERRGGGHAKENEGPSKFTLRQNNRESPKSILNKKTNQL